MPVYETTVEATFSATHAVRLPSGMMEEPHTHDWKVWASFRAGKLNRDGFVIDFIPVMDALHAITGALEGADLNKVVPNESGGASAERIAKYLADQLHERLTRTVYSVRVSEAAGCFAAYIASETWLDVAGDIGLG